MLSCPDVLFTITLSSFVKPYYTFSSYPDVNHEQNPYTATCAIRVQNDTVTATEQTSSENIDVHTLDWGNEWRADVWKADKEKPEMYPQQKT